MVYGLRQSTCRVIAKTFGSLKGIFATMAFYDQFHTIGWLQFCLGRVSKSWSKAYQAYKLDSFSGESLQSLSHLFTAFWTFTRKMWVHRNQIVHGATVEEAVLHTLSQLQDKIWTHYAAYDNNSSYVMPRHQYLFIQWSLQERLSMPYDGMTCWLCSVEEAHRILSFQEQHLQKTSQQVLSLFWPTQATDTISSTSTDIFHMFPLSRMMMSFLQKQPWIAHIFLVTTGPAESKTLLSHSIQVPPRPPVTSPPLFVPYTVLKLIRPALMLHLRPQFPICWWDFPQVRLDSL